jgi:hypothetical protein
METTLDLLQQAATKLSQHGSMKDRLADAYASCLIQIDASELPEAVRADFGRLCEAMTRERPLPRESAIRASVRKMSNGEAAFFAALVVRVFAAVARSNVAVTHTRRGTRAAAAATPIVQLFAADA